MITSEIKVNGSLLGVLYIRNVFDIDDDGHKCFYEVKYYEIGEGKVIETSLEHKKDDGYLQLINKSWQKILKITNKLKE